MSETVSYKLYFMNVFVFTGILALTTLYVSFLSNDECDGKVLITLQMWIVIVSVEKLVISVLCLIIVTFDITSYVIILVGIDLIIILILFLYGIVLMLNVLDNSCMNTALGIVSVINISCLPSNFAYFFVIKYMRMYRLGEE